jgi:hypothetical protein
MGTQTALYFPYIRVPQTAWFTQVLLYWDRAATIVPASLWGDDDEIDPYMRDLREAGLLSLLRPDDWLYELDDYGAFASGFLQLLDQSTEPMMPGKFVRLHAEKMGMIVFYELRGRGLARQGSGPWFEVEQRTADLYMAYLANVMSASHPGSLPVTDSSSAVGTLDQRGTQDERTTDQRLAALRYAVVEQALPAPQRHVPAQDLRRFKDDNAESLRRCRTHLDSKLADLSEIDNPALRKVKQAALTQEIQDDIARLHEQMVKRHWPKIALVGVGGVMGAALSMADQLSDASNPLALGVAVGTGMVNLGALGYGLYELLKQPRFDPRAPLAYAALAGQL